MDDIIKTTAKFQETEQPVKQKPLIQVEPVMPAAVAPAGAARPRPGRLEASSGGRDNPFRPDGQIYKSADPIVDFYRLGPSRTQSPSSSRGGSVAGEPPQVAPSASEAAENRKRACWRRWLCCCGCCNSSSNKPQRAASTKGAVVQSRLSSKEMAPEEVNSGKDEQEDLEISRFLRNKREAAKDSGAPESANKPKSIPTHLAPPSDMSRAREQFFSETTTVSLRLGNDKLHLEPPGPPAAQQATLAQPEAKLNGKSGAPGSGSKKRGKCIVS